MAVGGVHCLSHPLSDCVASLVGRSSLAGRVRFTGVALISGKARFRVGQPRYTGTEPRSGGCELSPGRKPRV